jgi:hypothetical protein
MSEVTPPAVETPAVETPAIETPAVETPAVETPTWRDSLPDELKADATLARYADVPALAKAHVEAHRVAKSKVVVPGADADEAAMGAFFDAIGRPASADDYNIPTVELPVDASPEDRAALAEAVKPFKEFAHKIGLRPEQATALGQFDLDRQAAYFAKGSEEIAALKAELGKDYEPKLAAAKKIATQLFGDDAEAIQLADDMDRKVGSARYVKAMMRLAEIAGEHGIVETDTVEGFGEVQDADAKLDQLQADPTWREKFKAGDPQVVAQRARLLELAKSQASRRSASARAAS